MSGEFQCRRFDAQCNYLASELEISSKRMTQLYQKVIASNSYNAGPLCALSRDLYTLEEMEFT